MRWRCPLCFSRFASSTSGDSRCQDCYRLFLHSPPLCARCLQPHALTECPSLREWDPPLTSISALYFGVGKTYDWLKKIKRSGLKTFPGASEWIRSDLGRSAWFAPLLTEVTHSPHRPFLTETPQTLRRRLQLNTPLVPLYRRILQENLAIPQFPVLRAREGIPRQGTLRAQERLKIRDRFDLDLAYECPEFQNREIILIEDFMTTGSTLQASLRALSPLCPRRVRVILLGYRPRLQATNPIEQNSRRSVSPTS